MAGGLGIILFFVAGFVLLIGLIALLVGVLDHNKQTKKVGGILLLCAAISMLLSFSLCSWH